MDIIQEAFVFLAAGVIAVPIAIRLGLGSVLGYLIAGALIGPYVLKLIIDAEDIMHVAEFGVIIMLFLIGLELQPKILWKMRTSILGLGSLQVITSTIVIATIGILVGLLWQTAMAIGLILSLSSTAIALQILNEKNLMNTEAGQSGFSVLLFQDIAVIPIIALLPILAVNTTNADFITDVENITYVSQLPTWQYAGIVFMVISSIIITGRYLTRPIFRIIAESGIREIFIAAALLIVISITLLMSLVDISPALGAFIAGIVLADSEYRHEIEANIAPFKALLLGLFFMSIGVSIDFSLIAHQSYLIFSLVASVISIKLIILWILAKLFDINAGDRYWFSFLLAQGGEFGFVLLALSAKTHVLTHETTSILTAVIVISMVMTPIIILLNEKFIQPIFDDQECNKEQEPMKSQHNPIILVGFGRFGQIIGRLLVGSNYKVTVLDHSARQIERVREGGYKVFYGDASREDLLHTAGAAKAEIIVIAINDREKTKTIVKIVKRHYPHLKIYVRAFDLIHYHELQELNPDHIERELFFSSLNMGTKVLQGLGLSADRAKQKAKIFSNHDFSLIKKLYKHRDNRKRVVSEIKTANRKLIEILEAEKRIFKQK